QGGSSVRTFNGDRSKPVGYVFKCHVVGDDVPFQVLEHLSSRFLLSVEQKMIFKTQNIGIGENTSLRVQKESVTALTRLELLDVISRHRMQQARAIFARHPNLPALGQTDPGGAFAKRPIARRQLHLREIHLKYAEIPTITAPKITALVRDFCFPLR